MLWSTYKNCQVPITDLAPLQCNPALQFHEPANNSVKEKFWVNFRLDCPWTTYEKLCDKQRICRTVGAVNELCLFAYGRHIGDVCPKLAVSRIVVIVNFIRSPTAIMRSEHVARLACIRVALNTSRKIYLGHARFDHWFVLECSISDVCKPQLQRRLISGK